MPRATREQALRRIIALATPHQPSEAEDPQMYYCFGAIIASAEDALGALADEREREAFRQAFGRGVAGLARSLAREG